MPVMIGTSLAYAEGHPVHWVRFLMVLAGMVFVHAGMNLANDYYDFKSGADLGNRNRGPFSGGGPALIEKRATPGHAKVLVVFSFAVSALMGISLALAVKEVLGLLIFLMVAGFLGGYFYAAPPVQLAYRGYGELFIFLCFGPLVVLGAYAVQSSIFSWSAVWAGFPVGFLITNVLWINQFPDAESDRQAGKMTLVVKMGKARARILFYLFFAAGFAALPVLFFAGVIKAPALVALIPALLALKASLICRRHYDNAKALLPAQRYTILVHASTGILMALGLTASGFIS